MTLLKTNLTAEVVIPSYNRLNILRNTLKHVRLLYPQAKICLGLQGAMPSRDFQQELDSDHNLRIVKLSAPNTPLTLNRCISTSKADIVLIIDDDAVPCIGWLESHINVYINTNLIYTTGREVRLNQGRSSISQFVRIVIEWIFGIFLGNDKIINGRIVGWINKLGFLFGNFDQPGTCNINSPRGCNMSVKRDIFLKAGGFNEQFRGNAWGFEADFGIKMRKQGFDGIYLGDAVVIHAEVSSGGSREASNKQWFKDYLFNHKLLINNLGPQAWIGSFPRLIRKRFLNWL